jgi:hypothetical protein
MSDNIQQGISTNSPIRATRSNLNNLINFQRQRLDNIISSNIDSASQHIENVNNRITTRRGLRTNRTRMNVLNASLDNAMDISTMSRNNQRVFNQYFDRLRSAGMSNSDINKISDTLRMESIEALEQQNYIKTGIRSAGRRDLPGLRRELAGVSYNYEMSKSTERALKYVGGQSSYGDAFRIGDEVTSTMVSKLNTAVKDYSQLTGVRNVSDLSRITDTNALNRFAQDLNVSVSDISRGNISNEQLRLLRQNGI